DGRVLELTAVKDASKARPVPATPPASPADSRLRPDLPAIVLGRAGLRAWREPRLRRAAVGYLAAVDWIREASAPVIFVSPPFSAYGNALPRSVSRERSFVRQSYK
ncbi:hypothetical protein ACWDR8_14430, partial [Nocardia farcinica]